MVRSVRAAAVVALVGAAALAGCQSDTIRTTSGGATTTTPGATTSAPSSVSVGGGSTTSYRAGGNRSSTSAAPHGSTSAPGGTSSANGVVLGGNSLGPTSLGTAADPAITAIRKVLGAPSRDLASPGAVCPGPERVVSWGRFSLYFSGGKLAGWGYDNTPPGGPQLSTPSGITVGSTVAALRRVYGDRLQVAPAQGTFPASFKMPNGGTDLTGTLTGTADTDTTTSLAYGVSCGD